MEPLTKTKKESSAALGAFDRLFNVCQFLGLSAIAIAAIVGFGTELWRMVTADTIALGDLLSPYMGFDTVEPYFEYEGRGVILLCRTSNPGGADIEELVTKDGDMVYERVAKMASGPWNVNGQVGLVVGATQPAEIARVRELAPETPLLVPGIGAQGGDVNAAVAAGLDAHGRGMIINSSRAVIFVGNGEDFAQAAAKAAEATMIAIREAKKKALS
jgi:orotidine-5'-phosphate decarboxylase